MNSSTSHLLNSLIGQPIISNTSTREEVLRLIYTDCFDFKTLNLTTEQIIKIKLLLDLFSRLHIDLNMGATKITYDWNKIVKYCSLTMGFKRKESYRVLYANQKHYLLADELCDFGTIDRINIYPREITKQAYFHKASNIIIVHNHPSGDPTPSKEDIEITKTLKTALLSVNTTLYDHLIVAHGKHFSFKNEGIL